MLESKNDESRFGLTRAPFSERRDAGAGPKPSLAIALLGTEDSNRCVERDRMRINSEIMMGLFTGLAFIYGLAVMLIVIVTLSKSARQSGQEQEKRN